MKKVLSAILALLLLCGALLCGCSEKPDDAESTTDDGAANTADFTVAVVDGNGDPYTSGVIVRFSENGEQVALKAIDGEGKATANLPVGEYSVELQFTGDANDFYYEKEGLTLSSEKQQLEIKLVKALTGDAVQVVYDGDSYDAYSVDAGSTYVKLIDGKRNFFLFLPEVSGTYEVKTSDAKATVGHYGYTAYILGNSISEVVDNVMTVEVSNGMVSDDGNDNPFVIGVDADGVDSCFLTITRVGDPPYSIEDEPWIVYEPTVELHKFTTPEGTVKQFDLTADSDAYPIVLNEEDNTYHLYTADGPQVLVQLGKSTQYLDSLANISTTAGLFRYYYDEEGNFVKRENYTSCMQIYSCTKVPEEGDRAQSVATEVYLDVATGLYPLTEDLKYVIQNHGEYVGWWDVNSPGYLFENENGINSIPDLNTDIAWMFLCCYVEQ